MKYTLLLLLRSSAAGAPLTPQIGSLFGCTTGSLCIQVSTAGNRRIIVYYLLAAAEPLLQAFKKTSHFFECTGTQVVSLHLHTLNICSDASDHANKQ